MPLTKDQVNAVLATVAQRAPYLSAHLKQNKTYWTKYIKAAWEARTAASKDIVSLHGRPPTTPPGEKEQDQGTIWVRGTGLTEEEYGRLYPLTMRGGYRGHLRRDDPVPTTPPGEKEQDQGTIWVRATGLTEEEYRRLYPLL